MQGGTEFAPGRKKNGKLGRMGLGWVGGGEVFWFVGESVMGKLNVELGGSRM